MVGDGPALESLRETYPEVKYWGFLNQTQLADVYRSANVFVFPSRTDTFGLVLLEALATGLPVAAYPVSGWSSDPSPPFPSSRSLHRATYWLPLLVSPALRQGRST